MRSSRRIDGEVNGFGTGCYVLGNGLGKSPRIGWAVIAFAVIGYQTVKAGPSRPASSHFREYTVTVFVPVEEAAPEPGSHWRQAAPLVEAAEAAADSEYRVCRTPASGCGQR